MQSPFIPSVQVFLQANNVCSLHFAHHLEIGPSMRIAWPSPTLFPAMTKRPTEEETGHDSKQLKVNFSHDQLEQFFNAKVFDTGFRAQLTSDIANSQPYRWGTVTELMDDTLLRNVRTEVLNEIAFTKKETDIYKVFQSGDLANLSGLDWNDLSRLPSLYKLRAAIYSQEFRDFISQVTGCGELSGVKTDMSVNTYTKGCHLLTHDDVIGSRRVSFILYLPEPDHQWKPHYGGALRLFPSIVPNVPKTDYEAKLVPQFNQIAFFTVQPGLSFHDVEEVRVDRQRLSIQGWFHIPQEGESGFVPGEQEATEAKSTLRQLQKKELQEFDFPKPVRVDFPATEVNWYAALDPDNVSLTKLEEEYLLAFMNPMYLRPEPVKSLALTFLEDSVIELTNFLREDYAEELRKTLRATEIEKKAPQLSSEIEFPWKCAVPPHKQRYMYMDGKSDFRLDEKTISTINGIGLQELPNFELTRRLCLEKSDALLAEIATFMKSIAFRKWLLWVTGFITTSDQILARKFRPGQDFILATTIDKHVARKGEHNVLLEGTLGLTPTAAVAKNWESGEFGGYELCMSMNDGGSDDEFEDDDPAIYKAGNDNDDSVLFTSQCQWNSLNLIVRDPSVLKFVKYVSINAKGSRWDINAQWNVTSQAELLEEK